MFALIRRLLKPCTHEWRGVANYYDRDLHVFLHLVRCARCGDTLIHEA